jgi:hypothetical protein
MAELQWIKNWKGCGSKRPRSNLSYCPELAYRDENTQHIWCHCWDSKQAPLKYNWEALRLSVFLEITMLNLMLTRWMHMELDLRPRVRLPVWYFWRYITTSAQVGAVWPRVEYWRAGWRSKTRYWGLLSPAVCGMNECFPLLCTGAVLSRKPLL